MCLVLLQISFLCKYLVISYLKILNNINLPIDITLASTLKEVSTPSLLNNSPSKVYKKQKPPPRTGLI